MIFKTLIKQNHTHEQIVFCSHPESKLNAIIAIHSTRLGPALGGCRMYPYQTEAQALEDVLRLSEAMSYKAAMANLKVGGGKSVIIADPEKHKTPELLHSFGSHIESLKGRYISGKDMGITVKDLQYISKKSSYVLGLSSEKEYADSPSYFTAKGVYYGIKEAVKWKLRKKSLKGVRIIIHGLGAVGFTLLKFLVQDQAQLFVFDIKKSVLKKLKLKFPHIKILSEEEVFTTPCEIFAPCSIGGIINEKSAKSLNCLIIAGGANNQLSSLSIEKKLIKKGVLYIPDFIINSGGLIYVSSFLNPRKSNKWVENKIKEIPLTMRKIHEASKKQKMCPAQLALNLAKDKIKKIKNTSTP